MNKSQILYMLNELNIKHNFNISSKNWLGILCPLPGHNDKHFGNCFINLDNGAINCFSCKQKGHIKSLYKEQTENFSVLQSVLTNAEKIENNEKDFEKFTINQNKPIYDFNFDGLITIPLEPEKFYYTNQRGFTKKFCDDFKITQCLSSIYSDYFIIPVQDSNKEIFEFEARKLCEYEYLKKFFNRNHSYAMLKSALYVYLEKKGLSSKDNNEIENSILKYILRKKVQYKTNSQIYRTLWNIENLDYNQDLHCSEGIGSIPKIYNNITSNVTAFFGSNIDREQLDYLKCFKKDIYILSDNDYASFLMIVGLHKELKKSKVNVISIFEKDTDNDFVNSYKNCKILKASEYIAKITIPLT